MKFDKKLIKSMLAINFFDLNYLNQYFKNNSPNLYETIFLLKKIETLDLENTEMIQSYQIFFDKYIDNNKNTDLISNIFSYCSLNSNLLTIFKSNSKFCELISEYREDFELENNKIYKNLNESKNKSLYVYNLKSQIKNSNLFLKTLNNSFNQKKLNVQLPESINEFTRLSDINSFNYQSIKNFWLLDCFDNFLLNNIEKKEIYFLLNNVEILIKELIDKHNPSNNLFSPVLRYVAHDILKKFNNNCKSINDLFLDVKDSLKTIGNINDINLNIINTPDFLKNKINNTQIKSFIWVLLENGDIVFCDRLQKKDSKTNMVYHNDLSGWNNVKSAGTAYFSIDMKNLLAINNGSGHYKPSLESLFLAIEVFKQNNFVVSNTIIGNYNFTELIKSKESINSNIKNIRINALESIIKKSIN